MTNNSLYITNVHILEGGTCVMYIMVCKQYLSLSAAARIICQQLEEPHHFTSLLHRFDLTNVTNRSR